MTCGAGDRAHSRAVGSGIGLRRRLIGLDVLRAVAVLLIVCGHEPFRMPDGAVGRGFWFVLRQVGLVGVDLLFVLSGFLIGGMLLREARDTGAVAVRRFLMRRALRIWPAYVLAVLLAWRWYHVVSVSDESGRIRGAALWEMWPYAAHVQNYYNIAEHHFGAAAVLQTWQVATLAHFYVIAAALIAGLAWVGRRTGTSEMRCVPWIVGATFVGCFAARVWNAPVATYVYNPWRNFFPTHLRLDEPMFGLLLAYWVEHCRTGVERVMRRGAWVVLALGVATVVPLAVRQQEAARFVVTWGYTLAGVGCGGLVMFAWWRGRARGLRVAQATPWSNGVRGLTRAIAMIGTWGYSIALWHQPAVEHVALRVRGVIGDHLVRWDSPWNFSVSMVAYVGLCVVTGGAMYWAVERPMMAVRARWMGVDSPRPPGRRVSGGAGAKRVVAARRKAG